MRTMLIAASAAAALLAGEAGAQRMVAHGPGGPAPSFGASYSAPGAYRTSTGAAVASARGGRWGSNVGGRWWAGANAPGGWGAYRRPARGWTLPGYWTASGFAIADWSTYGLGEPPAGYGWSRYYDDAVLVDGRGRVYDCVSGVDWNRAGYEGGYGAGYGGGYAGADTVYAGPGDRGGYGRGDDGRGGYGSPYAPSSPYAQVSPYAQQSPYAATAGYPAPGERAAPAYSERRGSGAGGALVGAAAGGVAGNLIAGRGNRLAGTLIGAGVGGAAGYAIDQSRSRRGPVAPGAFYDYPPARGGGPDYPPPPVPVGPTGVWHGADGTTVSTSGGYCCGGGATTTVTVQTAPVVTTTTTEFVEDTVTYRRHVRPVRHKWVRRASCRCD